MAYDKETKEFVLIGTTQNGNLKEAKMHTSSTLTNVNKYNHDGSIVKETTIAGMSYLPPDGKDAISMELNQYGEIEINKVLNARPPLNSNIKPQVIPIDTDKTMPTTNEIEEMKENSEGMEEIMQIIEEMKTENIIDDVEKTEILEKISNNGKSVEEDKEYLEKIAKNKRQEENKETQKEKTQEEIDEELWWVPNRDIH